MVQRPRSCCPVRARGTEHPAPTARRLGGSPRQAPRRRLLPARGRPRAPHSLCSAALPALALCTLHPRGGARPHSPAASSNSSGGGSRAARSSRAMVQRRRPQPQRRGARAGNGGAQSEGGGAREPRWPAYLSLRRSAAQSMQWMAWGRAPPAESGFAPAPLASGTPGISLGSGSRTLCAVDQAPSFGEGNRPGSAQARCGTCLGFLKARLW